ncbi:hypothetical protein [Streptomyces prasinus]|nr:hypothetical protein [Streptomyces prasinus]
MTGQTGGFAARPAGPVGAGSPAGIPHVVSGIRQLRAQDLAFLAR